jgi:hypothetical protein
MTSGKLNLRVGHWVEVRSVHEILATLDVNGCLDGLPFMPEMLKFCGNRYRVFKRCNKVIDMVRKTGLRKMTGTVILENIRCDGCSHGGCQAGCHLLWKEIWLRRVSYAPVVGIESISAAKNTVDDFAMQTSQDYPTLTTFAHQSEHKSPGCEFYRCQATQIFDASSYLRWWDPRQYFIDLWSGNITPSEFVRVTLINLFNAVQKLRGGCGYPHLEPGNNEKTPAWELNLMPGEFVQVKNKEEIQATLDKWSKNRGLWFDKEMLRYCGGRFRVLKRVERTIDEKTGRLIKLRNPCVILDGVMARGDYHRFNPQNEFIFWREIWLERVSP